MLYLEDYLEMIEHLPQELRDRFTEMREMDLQVQNTTDNIEERIRALFCNAKKLKTPERDAEYENIRKDYLKVLDDADEKVQQANQMYDLVDRYLRRLDVELEKFKMELEADNRGITEVLEKRSLELDMPNGSHSQKENRHVTSHVRLTERERESRRSVGTSHMNRQSSTASLPALDRTWYGEIQPANPTLPSVPLAVPAQLAATLSHSSSGSSIIAAAASQAIAVTQQMQQGRRSASMKASYEALQQFTQSTDVGVLSITPTLSLQSNEVAANSVVAATSTPSSKKQKKRRETVAEPVAVSATTTSPMEGVVDETLETEEWVEGGDWAPDPNEPRYCLCNQVSYGDMVACDNPDCPLEWFHYACVDITAPPKGKWYCPRCASTMKRRGRKN